MGLPRAKAQRPSLTAPARAGVSIVQVGTRKQSVKSNKETDDEKRIGPLRDPLTTKAPYKACSGFTRVTARRIAQPPKVTFVTRLRPSQLPDQAARQLPDLLTIIRVEPSSTDDSRLQGALPNSDARPAVEPQLARS